MADVEEPHNRRCTKGRGLLRKEGPPTYAILSRDLELSRFTRFLKGHHRAFYESHPALGVFSTKVSLDLKGFQQKSACFWKAFGEPTFGELSWSLISESLWRAYLESFQKSFPELSESFRRACFRGAFGEPAFGELSEIFQRAFGDLS